MQQTIYSLSELITTRPRSRSTRSPLPQWSSSRSSPIIAQRRVDAMVKLMPMCPGGVHDYAGRRSEVTSGLPRTRSRCAAAPPSRGWQRCSTKAGRYCYHQETAKSINDKKALFHKLFRFHARHRNIYTCFFENKSRGRYRTLRFPLAMQEKSARIGDAWANWFIG